MKAAVPRPRSLSSRSSCCSFAVGRSVPRRPSSADLEFHDCAYDAGPRRRRVPSHFLRNTRRPSPTTPCWCGQVSQRESPAQHHDGHTIPPGLEPDALRVRRPRLLPEAPQRRVGASPAGECMAERQGRGPNGGGATSIGTVPETDFSRPARRKRPCSSGMNVEKALLKKKGNNRSSPYDKHFYFVTDHRRP